MAEERQRPLKVFLCHASGDKPAVRALYQRLLRGGVDAWLDREKLLPGQDWQLEIPKAVRESDVVVVCLSNKSITKEGYIQKELRFALDVASEKPEGTIFIIPARLEECPVPRQLASWQWVDLFETDGYERLMRSLRLRADKLGLRVGDTTYTDREVEQRLDQLYTEGLAALWVEDWDKAYHRFQAILREKPDHIQALAKLEEAKRQRHFDTFYRQALDAQQNENWQTVVEILEKLASEISDYKDAPLLLKNARKKNQLVQLYNEAHRLHKAQQWQAVLKIFAQIAVIEPNYQDADGLLHSAEKELAEQKRLAELNELYSRGVHEMDAGRWYEARGLLEQVHKAQTGFLETERLLRKVENEIQRIEEGHKRNAQVQMLYEQARKMTRAGQWGKALAQMEEIQKLDNQFLDHDGIAEKAIAELAREEQEAQRQRELAALYAEAASLLEAKKYQEALDKWQEVKALDPKYPDRQQVQKTARKRLAEVGKTAGRKRVRFLVLQKRFLPLLVVISVILFGIIGVFILEGRPPILPNCTDVISLNDPLLMESNLNSSLVLVDGKVTYPSEWTNSKCYQVHLGGGCGSGASGIPSEWFLLNDEERLYLMVRFSKKDFTPTAIHFSYFYPYPYTGRWQFGDNMAFGQDAFDSYGWDETKWYDDTSDGGTMDTRAKSSQDNQSYWFEFSKPLDSGDGHDWIWKPGDKVGTGLTGDLMIGSFGTSSVAGNSHVCRLIQLRLAK